MAGTNLIHNAIGNQARRWAVGAAGHVAYNYLNNNMRGFFGGQGPISTFKSWANGNGGRTGSWANVGRPRTATATSTAVRSRKVKARRPRMAKKRTYSAKRKAYRQKRKSSKPSAFSEAIRVMKVVQPLQRINSLASASSTSGGGTSAVPGKQGVISWNFNSQYILANLFASMGNPVGTNMYQKLLIEKAYATIDFTNSSSGILHGCWYKIRPRRDIDTDPITIINQDFPNVPATVSVGYNNLFTYPATPFMSPKFCQYYKVVKTWGCQLNPGESRQYKLKLKTGLINASLLTGPASGVNPIQYFRRWTDIYMFIHWGAPVHDTGTVGGNTATISPTRFDMVQDTGYELRGITSLNTILQNQGSLGTLSNPTTYLNTGFSSAPSAI